MAANIREWLEGLGLGKYTDAFAENALDLDVLAKLDADDLKEIGIPLGDRKRLLAAIGDLATPTVGAATPIAPPARAEAERRHLTVMFADLVGSTAISADLDPEDMREVITAYQTASAEMVRRFDGHVAKFMGDGILAYFGYPKAHEDDAERAVRASLELIEAVGRLSPYGAERLKARVGIDTGLVVVGDLVGEGSAQEEAVVGDTPNRAARLQDLAGPDDVLISENTKLLLGATFTFADLGYRQIKGFAEPLGVWRVTGLSGAESRFEARAAAGLTPFIGRDEEIALLLQRWQQAKDGEGQVALLCGEPGIGKSRITQVFRERVGRNPRTTLRYQCSPYHTNSVLHPVIQQLERAAGFERDDDVDAKLAKLEDLVGSERNVPALFASMLSLQAGDRYSALNMSPQKQKEELLQAVADQVAALSEQQPVLMIFEDAHWIDPTSQDVLDLLIPRITDLRVLLVVTYRPEYEAPWSQGLGHLTTLNLNRLGRKQASAMVGRITGGKSLPDEVLDRIVAKTDGVPLFVEELTKTVIDSDIVTETEDAYELTGPLTDLAIPSTIQDSLMARLDRLAPVKEVAQIGACIGREFPYELLAAVSPLGENALHDALAQLVGAELIFARGTPPDASYLFKHALVQDTAYSSLLRSKRQQLHAGVAAALEASSSEAAPELLAHHYTKAGLVEPAIMNWQRAGQQAAQRAANLESAQYFQRALALLQTLPEDRGRDTTELKLLTHLGPALMVVKGWAAQEVGTVYERANELAGRLETSADLVPPLVGIWLFHNARGRYDLADALTEQLFHVAKSTSDTDLLLQAHHAAWPIPMFRGAFQTANEHIEQGLALYDYERHRRHALVYMGHDPAVCAHACGAQAVWALGLPDRAQRHGMQALELARRLGHTPTLAFALWYVSGGHAARGDAAAVLSAVEELLPLSQEQKFVQIEASAQFLGGWALASTGEVKEGLERMRVGFDIWNPTGMRTWLQMFTGLYADSLLRGRRYAEALEALDRALEIGRQSGEQWWESRIHHLRGEALLHSGDGESAAASLQKAIQVARAQDAKSWELRAATSLARLWAEQGKRQDAHDLLAPIHSWFTEGFDTPDLKDAKALLDELA